VTNPRPRNIAASVRQRLLDKSKGSARPFNELLQYYAIERFLYRLSRSPHAGNFILKGALMLLVWDARTSRSTMDIDMLGQMDNDPEAIVAMVREVCRQEVKEDGILFDPESVQGERITADAEYQGVRIRFRGMLDNARLAIQLDVGFGDVRRNRTGAFSGNPSATPSRRNTSTFPPRKNTAASAMTTLPTETPWTTAS